jgi:hypothetical protein
VLRSAGTPCFCNRRPLGGRKKVGGMPSGRPLDSGQTGASLFPLAPLLAPVSVGESRFSGQVLDGPAMNGGSLARCGSR